MIFSDVVQYLENLTIMPKTMPGLEKIRSAVVEKKWFHDLDPKKIITVAGTNGKGTTCAVLEALLLSANQKVGLYTSPHLIQTVERIRTNGADISEIDFIELFLQNKDLIEKNELSHFEALTLMAADYFFSKDLDYVIFEVGLGGTFDATNIFPNYYSVITKLGLDHQNILGDTIQDIAKNKFGIVKNNTIVVHHELPDDVEELKTKNSIWIQSKIFESEFQNNTWSVQTYWGSAEINLPGRRSAENAATALTLFENLGFEPKQHLAALNKIQWSGRMQKISWPNIQASIFLSGDHNPQGIYSLIEILKNYQWNTLHLIVGVGQDKMCDEMFRQLLTLQNIKLYLTVTPFKGRKLDEYPNWVVQQAVVQNDSVVQILDELETNENDIVLVTGSLYLVGTVLKKYRNL
jgi:dihydrofolate synthase / folylpolyglutamate synthase